MLRNGVVITQTYDMAAVAQACAASDPARGAEGLRINLGRLWPGLSFRTVLTRGGWYRSGGVVGIDKRRIADSLRAWAEQQASGDIQELLDRCLQTQMFATRLLGRTHYLTAQTGNAAADFVQLEVEELQEVLDRYLSDPDWLPDCIEEFLDPLDHPQVEPEPVGTARLVFRRLFSAREMIDPHGTDTSGDLLRFMRDWDSSSADHSAHFCDQWVLGVREFTDIDGEPRVSAHPVSTRKLETLSLTPGISGAALATLIRRFDHEAGYPMAWFFHMVASAGVPHSIGRQVGDDHDQGFSYLPSPDLVVLRHWLASPYRA